MLIKSPWKKEAELARKIVALLRKRNYLVYHIEAGVGASSGLPDLMILDKKGKISFIELKAVPRNVLMNADKRPELRFKFNGIQVARFAEMLAYKKDLWIVIANKGHIKVSAVKFSDIYKAINSTESHPTLISSANLGYILDKMDYK